MTYLFTYGTLRPTGSLDDLTPGRHVGQAVIPGKLYRHHRAHFPVLCDLSPDQTGSVIGDVFDVTNPTDLDFIIDMEAGAGYDVRIRRVTLTELAHPFSNMIRGDTVHAVTFTWPDRYPVGPRIYCGDWLSPEARDVCSDIDDGAGFAPRRT